MKLTDEQKVVVVLLITGTVARAVFCRYPYPSR